MQAAASHLEVGLVVAVSHMLEHADRGDAVEALLPASVEIAIVGQLDAGRQALQPLAGPAGLLARDGQAGACHAVMLGGMAHQSAPAAADVEQGHAGAQPQLAADQIELGQLRLFQRRGLVPVAAAVGHAGVEHGLEQPVAGVVMRPPHLPGARGRLHVDQPGLEREQQQGRIAHLAVQSGAQHAADEFIDALAVPPAFHVAFAQPQAAMAQHPVEGAGMVDLEVPGTLASQPDVSLRQQPLEGDASLAGAPDLAVGCGNSQGRAVAHAAASRFQAILQDFPLRPCPVKGWAIDFFYRYPGAFSCA